MRWGRLGTGSRDLVEEQVALVDGMPAAVERIERLAAQIDDANPFYKVSFTVQDRKITNTNPHDGAIGRLTVVGHSVVTESRVGPGRSPWVDGLSNMPS